MTPSSRGDLIVSVVPFRDLFQIVDRLDKSGSNFISFKERFRHPDSGRQVSLPSLCCADAIREGADPRADNGGTFLCARARGRLDGRKKVLAVQQTRVVNTMWNSREHTRYEIAAHFAVSVAAIDKF